MNESTTATMMFTNGTEERVQYGCWGIEDPPKSMMSKNGERWLKIDHDATKMGWSPDDGLTVYWMDGNRNWIKCVGEEVWSDDEDFIGFDHHESSPKPCNTVRSLIPDQKTS